MKEYYIKVSKIDYYTWKILAIILFLVFLVLIGLGYFNDKNKNQESKIENIPYNQKIDWRMTYLEACAEPIKIWLSDKNNILCDTTKLDDCEQKKFEYAKLYQQELICQDGLK